MSTQKVIHVGTPNIGKKDRFHQYVDEILDRKWLTNGGEVLREFESVIAEYLKVKHCIAVCNGTMGLELAIQALGLTGEVIVPSMTFVATAHALHRHGVTPVFCDIDHESYNIDPQHIESLITSKTSGILGVHAYGLPCQINALKELADKSGLKLFFDAAHAFGCSYNSQMIGNFGNCEVFSFHATKFFNTCEGGAVATNDDALALKIRQLMNFGFSGIDKVVTEGTNGKMSEIHAAMGLVNFESLDTFIDTNRRNYEEYKRQLANTSGIEVHSLDSDERLNHQYVVIEVHEQYPLTRDELMTKLHKNNILARRYFWPGCHNMEPYKSLYPGAKLMLTTTEQIAKRLLVLPTGTAVDLPEIQQITNYINEEV